MPVFGNDFVNELFECDERCLGSALHETTTIEYKYKLVTHTTSS